MVSLARSALYGIAGFTYGNLVQADGGSTWRWNPWLGVGRSRSSWRSLVGLAVRARLEPQRGHLLPDDHARVRRDRLSSSSARSTTSRASAASTTIDLARRSSATRRRSRTPLYYVVASSRRSLVFLLIRYIARTPFGLTLQGIRDDPTRMRALGYNVALHRTLAFGFGAFIAASPASSSSGGTRASRPESINLGQTIDLLVIAVDRRPATGSRARGSARSSSSCSTTTRAAARFLDAAPSASTRSSAGIFLADRAPLAGRDHGHLRRRSRGRLRGAPRRAGARPRAAEPAQRAEEVEEAHRAFVRRNARREPRARRSDGRSPPRGGEWLAMAVGGNRGGDARMRKAGGVRLWWLLLASLVLVVAASPRLRRRRRRGGRGAAPASRAAPPPPAETGGAPRRRPRAAASRSRSASSRLRGRRSRPFYEATSPARMRAADPARRDRQRREAERRRRPARPGRPPDRDRGLRLLRRHGRQGARGGAPPRRAGGRPRSSIGPLSGDEGIAVANYCQGASRSHVPQRHLGRAGHDAQGAGAELLPLQHRRRAVDGRSRRLRVQHARLADGSSTFGDDYAFPYTQTGRLRGRVLRPRRRGRSSGSGRRSARRTTPRSSRRSPRTSTASISRVGGTGHARVRQAVRAAQGQPRATRSWAASFAIDPLVLADPIGARIEGVVAGGPTAGDSTTPEYTAYVETITDSWGPESRARTSSVVRSARASSAPTGPTARRRSPAALEAGRRRPLGRPASRSARPSTRRHEGYDRSRPDHAGREPQRDRQQLRHPGRRAGRRLRRQQDAEDDPGRRPDVRREVQPRTRRPRTARTRCATRAQLKVPPWATGG